jgi:hypothetical protein
MRQIKQSTARNIEVLMMDANDGKTGMTGKTLTVKIAKNGGAFSTITPTVTEQETGSYVVALTSAHTDTLGDLGIKVSAAGCDIFDTTLDVTARLTDDLATPTNITAGTITAVTNDVGITQGGADKVWLSAVRSLTTFGTLVADIWSNLVRTLSDKTGFSLTPAYDAAKTAASVTDLEGIDITFTGPMTGGDDISLVRGDDYYDADARALEWTVAGLVLTGATAKFEVGGLSITCTIVGQVIKAEVSKVQSATLAQTNYEYRMVVTKGGHVMTQIIANCSVR